ncbi:class I SAM-dependent DNA methyltransferase [Pseudomonas sp. R9.37]|uniref:HsdM family class I SAM-dependent methyltransferase n=1 Tax=Pseudomonas sp. R9.37 TaxID=1390498 RepID=UPI001304F5D9|nr:N-6 DNA methylase [Pseudomonas sp. R9.37]
MSDDLLSVVENSRIFARDQISEKIKKLEEQYFTPPRIAQIMTNLFSARREKSMAVLDPCAGVGNLTAALYEFGLKNRELQHFTLIERDPFLYESCVKNFSAVEAVQILNADFFQCLSTLNKFDRIILNPPYAKLNSASEISKQCVSVLGYPESNLYSAFISHCLKLLAPEGELVAIVPRSFCNGALFKNFRKNLSDNFYLQAFYLFESRKIFSDSNILQEVIIIKVGTKKPQTVKIYHENNAGDSSSARFPAKTIVFPTDPTKVIHIPMAEGDRELLSKISKFPCTLKSQGFRASTGKVVDFRCVSLLKTKSSPSTVNLIYQDCVNCGAEVTFLTTNNKPRHIINSSKTKALLITKNNYILIRRISFKEAPTRIIASPLLTRHFIKNSIAVENHLNYIWGEHIEITEEICLALSAYLSCKTVDRYVRRFSGHTQINAADLNSLPIPDTSKLAKFFELNKNLSLLQLITSADNYFFD